MSNLQLRLNGVAQATPDSHDASESLLSEESNQAVPDKPAVPAAVPDSPAVPIPDRLAPDTHEAIKQALKNIQTTMPGFKPRRSQRQMIAEVARTLAGEYDGERVICVEGPTGTGKSLGYLLAGIPVARQRGKHLVIATATVALQEQLVNKDLPEVKQRSGLDFTVALAKGRRRYLCDRNAYRLAGHNEHQQSLDLGEEDTEASWSMQPEAGDLETVRAMVAAREKGDWNGDLDDWPNVVRSELQTEITTGHPGCTGKRCPFYTQCSFYRSRWQLKEADVIVANHALVVADLMLGGGAILPPQEDCIYIFDEGHHLSSVAIDQGNAETRLVAPKTWLADLGKYSTRAAALLAFDGNLASDAQAYWQPLQKEIPVLGERLDDLHRYLKATHPSLQPDKQKKGGRYSKPSEHWRFAHGKVPDDLRDLFRQADLCVAGIWEKTLKLVNLLKQGLTIQPTNSPLLTHLSRLQFILARLKNMEAAFMGMAYVGDYEDRVPVARWVTVQDKGEDFLCCASPVSAADQLRGLLWSQCDGAVVTSATLTSLGRFNRLFEQLGLGGRHGTRALRLASPFDYANNAVLSIPSLSCSPKDSQAHTAEIIERFNGGLVDPDAGTLVLFASYYQMRGVAKGLRRKLKNRLLMQGEASRQELLESHRTRVAEGKGSVLFGVASMAEGVDLPGAQCTHVIVAKLAFSVPDSPVEATYAEWLEEQGRNPFMEMSVPDASFRLVQATGRLLRSESDTGRVTILDPRLKQKTYGRQMLAALPPFRRED